MKYSIIIPTLNEEKLLPKLLMQLTANELRNKFDIEIIVSDGGSSDKTVEIALSFADKVTVHHGADKQNIAAGRNEGVTFAAGDILIFLNADVRLPNTIKLFEFLENNFAGSEYLALTGKVKIFPEEEIIADKFYQFIYNSYFRVLNMIGIGMGRGECQVIKRKAFEAVNGFNEALAAGEDFDMYRRIRKNGKILYTGELCVFESPRRYRKIGYKAVTLSWLKNGFSVFLQNKSSSKEWEEVR